MKQRDRRARLYTWGGLLVARPGSSRGHGTPEREIPEELLVRRRRIAPLLVLSLALMGTFAGVATGGGWWNWSHQRRPPIMNPKQAAEVWALAHAPSRFRSPFSGLARNNTWAICAPRYATWSCEVGHGRSWVSVWVKP